MIKYIITLLLSAICIFLLRYTEFLNFWVALVLCGCWFFLLKWTIEWLIKKKQNK